MKNIYKINNEYWVSGWNRTSIKKWYSERNNLSFIQMLSLDVQIIDPDSLMIDKDGTIKPMKEIVDRELSRFKSKYPLLLASLE